MQILLTTFTPWPLLDKLFIRKSLISVAALLKTHEKPSFISDLQPMRNKMIKDGLVLNDHAAGRHKGKS